MAPEFEELRRALDEWRGAGDDTRDEKAYAVRRLATVATVASLVRALDDALDDLADCQDGHHTAEPERGDDEPTTGERTAFDYGR